MPTAIIIKGNPRYVNGNVDADVFYAALRDFLEELGYTTSFDPGEPYTQPAPADLWIGHSRGVDRLRFAPPETITIRLGAKGGVNHLKDKALGPECPAPDIFHYTLSLDMKEQIKTLIAQGT